ncbi:MAG: hypothetical protein MJ010_00465 [Paludibacteraceae bacterium]|nr:hypothetical protein [Paludibacteraceae bacterium]
MPKLKKGDIVYRVYGGDSGIDGQSWTTVKPSDFEGNKELLIDGLGLPKTNTAKYVIKAEVIDPSRCKIKTTGYYCKLLGIKLCNLKLFLFILMISRALITQYGVRRLRIVC